MLSFALRISSAIDSFNRRVGRMVMYGVFLMIAVLAWSSISKTFLLPANWTLEIAQFSLVAYYMLGGSYAIQLKSNVRMDLFYGEWSVRKKAQIDAFTVFFLMFYLAVLLHGGLGSLAYSLGHFKGDTYGFFASLLSGDAGVGRLERSPTAWRPYLWPIKLVMCIGVFMMLLQAISELIKDLHILKESDNECLKN